MSILLIGSQWNGQLIMPPVTGAPNLEGDVAPVQINQHPLHAIVLMDLIQSSVMAETVSPQFHKTFLLVLFFFSLVGMVAIWILLIFDIQISKHRKLRRKKIHILIDHSKIYAQICL